MTFPDVRLTGAKPSLDPSIPISPLPAAEPTSDAPIVGSHGSSLRVLVIGINYGPEHTGIAPYTTQLCEYLAEHGASVSVFTGIPHYPSWAVEPRYRWRVRHKEMRDGVHIRRLWHYVPRRQSAARRGLYELTFALHVATQRATEPPDVVLAVVPSLLSALVAKRIAARARVPLVIWVQDLMGKAAAQSGIDGGARIARLVGSIERHILKHADEVLVLNSQFANYAESIGIDRARVTVRPNWTHIHAPSHAERQATRFRLGWRPDTIIVLHSGNMGLKQALENVIAAGQLADQRTDNKVKFVLMGEGSQRETLEEKAKNISAVEFLPPVPTRNYADVLVAADILLINERASSVDMSLPSKLTSYLHVGQPVIAASPSNGGTAAEIGRSRGGIVVEPENPHALLRAVDNTHADLESTKMMRTLGRRYAEEHLSSKQALERLLATLTRPRENSLTSPPSASQLHERSHSRPPAP